MNTVFLIIVFLPLLGALAAGLLGTAVFKYAGSAPPAPPVHDEAKTKATITPPMRGRAGP